jgi:hypothetical protein
LDVCDVAEFILFIASCTNSQCLTSHRISLNACRDGGSLAVHTNSTGTLGRGTHHTTSLFVYLPTRSLPWRNTSRSTWRHLSWTSQSTSLHRRRLQVHALLLLLLLLLHGLHKILRRHWRLPPRSECILVITLLRMGLAHQPRTARRRHPKSSHR